MKVDNPTISTYTAVETTPDNLPKPGGPGPKPGPAPGPVPAADVFEKALKGLPQAAAHALDPVLQALTLGQVNAAAILGGGNPGQALAAKSLATQAKQAGLSEDESKQLEKLLKHSTDFKQDSKLVRDLLATKNPDRALQTFLDLDPIRQAHPGRVTPDLVRSLTLGVGQNRTSTSQGNEGILGHQQAVIAAKTLADMPQSEYNSIKGALDNAGAGVIKKGADPQTERALILKATAARHDALVDHPVLTSFLNKLGLGNPATNTITDFANTIHGMDRNKLIHKTSVIDLDVDGKDSALQQRFSTSCGPTALQIAHSEADPVYSWNLHNDTIHDTNNTCPLATEEKTMLNNNGGNAVARNAAGGQGMWVDTQLNQEVSPASGHPYTRTNVGNTAAARTVAADAIEKAVKNGADVPIVVGWPGGGLHYQMITDTRGTGDKRQFLLTDPWTGRTDWINRKDLINGNNNFFAGTGSLTDYYL